MASGNQWVYDIESTVLAIVKAKSLPQLQKKYPKIRFTDEGTSDSAPVFPTVYIHLLSPLEAGRELDGKNINAVIATFQVDVSTNASKADCRKVMSTVMDVFKSMRFAGAALPEQKVEDKIYKSTARLSRIIGANDRLM